MFQHGAFQLVVNGELSESIERNCGLPQGSPLSPIIFDMFVDSLVHRLNRDASTDLPNCLFFADDGLLLPRTKKHGRNMLNIAEKWAKENGMNYNVSKCGVIYTDLPTVGDTPLILFGDIIPIVSTYKYLGFPITSQGIDFDVHIQTQITSASSFLKFVQVQCSEWSPYTRYIIYNTFVRPKLEYGAPLTYTFSVFSNNKTLLHSLQTIQNTTFSWIFNSNIKRPNVLQGILGALPIDIRFSHLRTSFQLHLQYCDNNNPLQHLIQKSKSNQYIYRLKSDKGYSEFLNIPDLPTSHIQLKQSMFQFLSSRRSEFLAKSKSLLVNYIPRTARSDSLIDRTILSPIQYQRMFLAWRRGTLFWGMKCICGQKWTRGHISCLSDFILPSELDANFNAQCIQHSKNFCKVDFLLNVQEWERAAEILSIWQTSLSATECIKV